MKTLNRLWYGAACCAVMAALLSISQISRGEDAPAAGVKAATPASEEFVRPDDSGITPPVATQNSLPQPRYTIPSEMADPAFERFVDLKLLGDAYSYNDPVLMVDVGLQLLEGERVLLRSHHGLKGTDVLDVALRMATGQNDTATLDRLTKVAEKTGDKSLADKLTVSRQLASQTRAAAPPIPEDDESLSSDDIQTLQEQMHRLERAQALGDVPALRMLQTELETTTIKADPLNNYLKAQVAESIANLPPAEDASDDVVKLLGDLSGATRGITTAARLETIGGAVYREALPFDLDTVNKRIFIHAAGKPAGGGVNEWLPQNCYYGLRGRFGRLYINYNEFLEIQVDATGKPLRNALGQTIRTGRVVAVYRPNPDYVNCWTRNPVTRRLEHSWLGMKDAYVMNLEDGQSGEIGPIAVGGNALTAANAELQPAARIIAMAGGNFTWREINGMGAGGVTFSSIVAAGGGNIYPGANGIPAAIYQKAGANPNGGATMANIVAAGGGKITPNSIVINGGGGYHKPMVPSNLTIPASVVKQMWSSAALATLIQDGGAYLIGQDGASLKNLQISELAKKSNLIGTGVGSFVKNSGERVSNYRLLSGGSGGNTYFRSAEPN